MGIKLKKITHMSACYGPYSKQETQQALPTPHLTESPHSIWAQIRPGQGRTVSTVKTPSKQGIAVQALTNPGWCHWPPLPQG